MPIEQEYSATPSPFGNLIDTIAKKYEGIKPLERKAYEAFLMQCTYDVAMAIVYGGAISNGNVIMGDFSWADITSENPVSMYKVHVIPANDFLRDLKGQYKAEDAARIENELLYGGQLPVQDVYPLKDVVLLAKDAYKVLGWTSSKGRPVREPRVTTYLTDPDLDKFAIFNGRTLMREASAVVKEKLSTNPRYYSLFTNDSRAIARIALQNPMQILGGNKIS